MTKPLSAAAFVLGAMIILWMAGSFIGSHPLALIITVIIGAVYAAGFAELLHFQQATRTLENALGSLQEKVTDLDHWLARLHPSLHNAVRLRIEGEHLGLPAPVLTPYLVGLLVMLGLLGTFFGMVETLKGAVTALEGSTELEAVRAGLAAPMKGLGMAFGTSVAGVAASAMLGFISTLSRRQRMIASRVLDSKIKTVFCDYSLAWNRQQTYKAMQQQAEALPQVAVQLTELGDKLGRLGDDINRQLNQRQEAFHASVSESYTELARQVGETLKQTLSESGRLAGESIQPAITALLDGIREETRTTQKQLTETTEQQLQSINRQFADTSEVVSNTWQQSLAEHSKLNLAQSEKLSESLAASGRQLHETGNKLLGDIEQRNSRWLEQQAETDKARLNDWAQRFDALQEKTAGLLDKAADNYQSRHEAMLESLHSLLASTESLVDNRIEQEKAWLDKADDRLEKLTGSVAGELKNLRDDEAERGKAAVERLDTLQTAVKEHLSQLGQSLEAPMTRLIETASETPKAAAEVIEKLRSEISKNLERDNSLLEERRRIMAELSELSGSMEQAASSQRQAIEKMVSASADMLKDVAAGFSTQIEKDSSRMAEMVDQFTGSATELASLGDAFQLAVELFTESNRQLIDKLGGIEQSLQQSDERSNEQLAYYVAQAREIIDHNILSQQELINQMQQISRPDKTTGNEA